MGFAQSAIKSRQTRRRLRRSVDYFRRFLVAHHSLIRNIRTWSGATSQWVQRLTANCSLSFIQTEAIISASSAQDAQADENVSFMKKRSNKSARKPMRDEYDFSQGERGKYARRYAEGTNVVVLEPDVAKVFSDSKSVNVSLRRIIRKQTPALAK
jgi:hypothetical protein